VFVPKGRSTLPLAAESLRNIVEDFWENVFRVGSQEFHSYSSVGLKILGRSHDSHSSVADRAPKDVRAPSHREAQTGF